uniref:LysR family transcriptional regulator n=1 Tax=Staphylococcus haemolyticus TaxID=1283 RepID=UPI0015D6C102
MYSRQIEVFVKVVEQKSFSKAAEELFISSTAIMKQINSLEDQVGVTLLNRSNKGVSLTPAGKSFYEDAKEIIKLSNQAIQRAKNIMSG